MARTLSEVCVCGADKLEHHIIRQEDKIIIDIESSEATLVWLNNEIRMMNGSTIMSHRFHAHEYRRDNLKYLEELNNG